jgi:nucleoside 2-deoxyribosyltransferase
MKQIIYLIGQISSKSEETYLWREDFKNRIDFYCLNDVVEIIDPCKNNFNNDIKNKNFSIHETYNIEHTDVLVSKDRNFVKQSTIGIANLNTYDKDKPIIGTLFELAWYFDSPEKGVIGIFDGDYTKDKICNHPFVKQSVTLWVKTEQEAFNIIKNYFI